ncbi:MULTISPECIES: 3'(2'),5'-bisphosphate nucleotidase CysQ [unclassified Sphingomonas]|uniref:3'(2'),5'-bisphosphate nucleotidase CysQ n=1 Tax=unclassified Sphingomonas TaxID=196159 RepID=UPI0008320D26|nr:MULTISPECIES: 3'(2'),5'-bisphosphate nucleotidase CysQ [unclassified Sphingomonas]
MTAGAQSDVALARDIAERAGALLMDLRRTSGLAGPALGAAGDRAADDLIHQLLAGARPDDAILSEERVCDRSRLDRSRVWIVDPLDGTREYAEGRDDWAVHVALAIEGRPAIGAVALPALGRVFASDPPFPLPAPAPRRRMVVSRTRPAEACGPLCQALDAETIPMGSAGAKAMAILMGSADIYFHSGGQYEWDNCAPAAVAMAAGLHVSRIDGSPIRYNQPEPSVPDFLICHRADADRILRLIAA